MFRANSFSLMKPRLLLLVLCLTGNGLLATAVVRKTFHPSPAVNPPVKKVLTASPEPSAAQNDVPATAIPAGLEDFQWSQLTSPDYFVYIARLRAFSTPEPEVREIIYGLVEATYRPKRGALRPTRKTGAEKFWERRQLFGDSDPEMTKPQRQQMRMLNDEESNLLESLFGDDFYEQMAKDEGNDWMVKNYAFIPEELRKKVQDIERRMNEEKQEIYADYDGAIDQESQAELTNIEKKYNDELAQILTPEQLLEWNLRHSDTSSKLKYDLSAFDPTEDEFRAIFKYKQSPNEDELAQVIGTNRLAEYKLEQDYNYRNLIDSGVAKESVFKLDEMKTQAVDAANKIRSDQSLSADERSAALSALRTETQNSINDLLGAKPAKRYTSQGGRWLNNIGPVTKP